MESLFEEKGGTYTLDADGMYYPDLELPEEETPRYSKYGRKRHTYLRKHKKIYYTPRLLNDKLVAHLNEIDDTANSRMELIIKKMTPMRTTKYERECRTALGYIQEVEYIASTTI